MVHEQSLDTKNKIMDVALTLFAEKGVEGASVREIAKNADVNIAAINYHFASKQNLFLEVIKRGRENVTTHIVEQTKSAKNTEELVLAMFDLFLLKGRELVSHFKMMLSHDVTCMIEGDANDMIGPPGGEEVAKFISQDIGRKLTQKEIHWVLHVIYSHIIHLALIENTSCSKLMKENQMWDLNEIKKGTRRLVRLLLEDLKK